MEFFKTIPSLLKFSRMTLKYEPMKIIYKIYFSPNNFLKPRREEKSVIIVNTNAPIIKPNLTFSIK